MPGSRRLNNLCQVSQFLLVRFQSPAFQSSAPCWSSSLPSTAAQDLDTGLWSSRRFQKEVLSLPSALASSSQVRQQLHRLNHPAAQWLSLICTWLIQAEDFVRTWEKQDSGLVVGPRPTASPCLITRSGCRTRTRVCGAQMNQ